jgi:hypothetical protein
MAGRHACLCVPHADRCSHVPNKGEQMVRYYGYYSNPARLAVSRGKRQKTSDDGAVAYILEPPMPEKAFRKNWARLIQKIYEVDPLVCPRCQEEMRVIAFIEEQEVIRKILTHLGLWQIKARPRPVAHAPPDLTLEPFDDWPACLRATHRQAPSADDYLTDPLYSDEV